MNILPQLATAVNIETPDKTIKLERSIRVSDVPLNIRIITLSPDYSHCSHWPIRIFRAELYCPHGHSKILV